MAKRSDEGTVFQNGKGQWMAMIELPRGPDGKRKRRLRRADTKAEARKKLNEMRAEIRQTGTVSDARRTVSQAVEAFRESRPDSADDPWLTGLILAGLGGQKVKSLTVAVCDDFLSAASLGEYGERPIGSDHIRRLKQRLVAVLNNEMRLGLVQQNVAQVAELPPTSVDRREQQALTVEELRRLIEVAEGLYVVLIDLCGRNALRPAEARALCWSDIDVDRRELSVTGQMTRYNKRGPVKRASNARRTIGIDRSTIGRLEDWREVRCELETVAGSGWLESDFVVVNAAGKAIGREAFAIATEDYSESAGIDPHVTPYGLRHTAISHQADAGATSWEIADWAGTSEAMISSRYRHRLRRVSKLRPVDDGTD